ncbi:acyltransferase family protein [Rubripirellula amarantea]|uniref:acyltransferase family protein n=1 Tax=Rubripirellula amarantea TaxID=2527999 RepID=UPI0011B75D78|nr:acyltransferase [Rubripirellula amarantea]
MSDEVESATNYIPAKCNRDRVVLLDVFRVVAALAVVMYHYAFRGNAAGNLCDVSLPSLHGVVRYGYLGVEFFFVISGFVIAYTAFDRSIRKFAISRAIRLYPAFWICCSITFVVTELLGGERYNADILTYLVNLTLLAQFVGFNSIDGVYWSLYVEIQFYCFVGICIWLRQIDRLEYLAYLWLVLSGLLIVFPSFTISQMVLAQYAPLFVGGILFFLCYRDGPSITRISGIVLSMLAANYYAIQKAAVLSDRYGETLNPLIVVGLVTTIYCAFVPVVFRWVSRIPLFWTTLGTATYPLYLLHQNVGYMLMNSMFPELGNALSLAITTVLVLLVSLVLAVYLEPVLRHRLRDIVATKPRPAK